MTKGCKSGFRRIWSRRNGIWGCCMRFWRGYRHNFLTQRRNEAEAQGTEGKTSMKRGGNINAPGAANPKGCWKLAGDNIPGNKHTMQNRPGRGDGNHHNYRSSYSTPLAFNNSKYSS